MSQTPTTFEQVINEQSSAVYTATLTDENGAAIGAGVINALTLTFWNVADGAIVNSRNGQDVLNLNNVTVSAGGVLVWTLQPLDTTIVDDTRALETHRATFSLQFNGVSYENWDVDFTIRNLGKVV